MGAFSISRLRPSLNLARCWSNQKPGRTEQIQKKQGQVLVNSFTEDPSSASANNLTAKLNRYCRKPYELAGVAGAYFFTLL